MTSKQVLLVALVLVNLLLAAAVLVQVVNPPEAQAQGMTGGYNFAVTTGRLPGNEDGLWVLDMKTRKLALFRLPQEQSRTTMELVNVRTLTADIRGERNP